jgi:hypothetical protein
LCSEFIQVHGFASFIVVEASLSWTCDRSGHNTAFFGVIEPKKKGFAPNVNHVEGIEPGFGGLNSLEQSA